MNDNRYVQRHINARLRPLVESAIVALRPLLGKDEQHFVFTAMLKRYVEDLEFLSAGGILQLNETEALKFIYEFDGLQNHLSLPTVETMKLDDAVEEVVGWMAIDGYPTTERRAIRKSLSKRKKGIKRSPESAQITITALELHFIGKTDNQVADMLCDKRRQHNPHRGDTEIGVENPCALGFRKRRRALNKFLDKCGFEFAVTSRH